MEPEVDTALDPVRRRANGRRKGNRMKFVQCSTEVDGDDAHGRILEWSGEANSYMPRSLSHYGRWRIFDLRTSDVPVVTKCPYTQVPSLKSIKRLDRPNQPRQNHFLWPRHRRCPDIYCFCGEHHKTVLPTRSRKPEFLRQDITVLPEFAVVPQSTLEALLSLEPGILRSNPLDDASKRYLQHLIRRYEIKKAEFEKNRAAKAADSTPPAASPASTEGSLDFSMMKSIEIPVPYEPMWVVIFSESSAIDRSLSDHAAGNLAGKLADLGISYVRVSIPATVYPPDMGFRSQQVFGRWADGDRRSRRHEGAKRNSKENPFKGKTITFW